MEINQLAFQIKDRSDKLSKVVKACQTLLDYPQAEKHKRYIKTRMSSYYIEKYEFGYFPSDHELFLLEDLVDKEILKELRLTYPKRGYVEEVSKGLFNYNNLILPYYGEYGNIIALAGRTLLDEREQRKLGVSKYKNSFFEKSLHLFGLNRAKRAIETQGCAFLVEGQIDCIKCITHGHFNVVALTGSNLTSYQVYLLKKMTKKIYLLFDNDDAGNKAASKAIHQFKRYIDIEKLNIPNKFNDIDECLSNGDEHDLFDVR